jgi:hypothetical protein
VKRYNSGVRRLVLAVLLGSIAAYGQRVVFTMVTPATSPVMIASVQSSRDFGFQTLALFNDSDKTIDSIRFRVVLTRLQARDEVVDGGHVYARLEPGDRKNVDVFLGRLSALVQRARELKLAVARAVVTVEAVDYSDGSQWLGDQLIQDIPIQPALPR